MGLISGIIRELSENIESEKRHKRVYGIDSMGFLTYRCTSKCKTCNIWQRPNDYFASELGKDDWFTVLSRLKSYGTRSFEIFGGDALLRKDVIFDVVSYCKENNIKTYFPTNANLTDEETVKRLVEAGLDTIYFSIDDVGEGHDEVRGLEGTFARITRSLENVIKYKNNGSTPEIIVCSTISNMNYRNFPKLIQFLEGYDIDAVYPRFLVEIPTESIKNSEIGGVFPDPYFATSEEQSHLLGKEELAELKSIFKELKKGKRNFYINFRPVDLAHDSVFLEGKQRIKECHACTTFATINPNGDVVPCPFYQSYVLGNLLNDDMKNIWGNDKHKKFLEKQQNQQLDICKYCAYPVYYPSLGDTLKYYSIRIKEKIAA